MLIRKYNNRFCAYNGIKFHSQLERDLYLWLKVLISKSLHADSLRIDLQKRIKLVSTKFHGKISYICDYYLYHIKYGADNMKEALILDAKGVVTTCFSQKKTLVKAIHDLDIICVKNRLGLSREFKKWVSKYEG